jgi:hypothetical protein
MAFIHCKCRGQCEQADNDGAQRTAMLRRMLDALLDQEEFPCPKEALDAIETLIFVVAVMLTNREDALTRELVLFQADQLKQHIDGFLAHRHEFNAHCVEIEGHA